MIDSVEIVSVYERGCIVMKQSIDDLINYNSDSSEYLDMTFGPKWDYVSLTKAYIENFLLINLVDKAFISKIAMTASELLENSVKFSTRKGIRFKIKENKNDRTIEVIVYNYAEKEQAIELLKLLEEIEKRDPLKFYIQKMKESVDLVEGESGLGLPRISYEGGAKIIGEYYEETGVMKLTAIFDLTAELV